MAILEPISWPSEHPKGQLPLTNDAARLVYWVTDATECSVQIAAVDLTTVFATDGIEVLKSNDGANFVPLSTPVKFSAAGMSGDGTPIGCKSFEFLAVEVVDITSAVGLAEVTVCAKKNG